MKFDNDACSRLIEAVREGNYRETAARLAGIGRSTFYRWLDKARESPEGPYGDFAARLDAAEAEAEADAVRDIREAGRTTWQARAWYLERRHPSRWGRRAEVKEDDQGDKAAEKKPSEWTVPVETSEPAH